MESLKKIKNQAVDNMLQCLPDKVGRFEGSEYFLPIKQTFQGDEDISIKDVHDRLIDMHNEDVKDLLEPMLLAAELFEASCEDKDKYFINDGDLQSKVFMGSKWRAGWVLVLGGQRRLELMDSLKAHGFMVFTDVPGIQDTVYIGNRPTSPIYFLQMMVRYGFIWGRIAPGDDHEMGHYLEKDVLMPSRFRTRIKESGPPK